MEKAVMEVDESLSEAYLSRRAPCERLREAFWDTTAMAASAVYEDSARLRTVSPVGSASDCRNGTL
ncbi:hypothetical protein Rhopal_007635-T1 [Rhodotorula paludigena]|uniref:Uncharacterized protein n=1 Tax=Rhodotorula paludigena TaxID=86838 RepID=A0AAV5GZY7_9BASI|nr:hypothetical protein Rhopal_007635-T1 [Rhodotorula paludigena]